MVKCNLKSMKLRSININEILYYALSNCSSLRISKKIHQTHVNRWRIVNIKSCTPSKCTQISFPCSPAKYISQILNKNTSKTPQNPLYKRIFILTKITNQHNIPLPPPLPPPPLLLPPLPATTPASPLNMSSYNPPPPILLAYSTALALNVAILLRL